jgi:hypothetical protein
MMNALETRKTWTDHDFAAELADTALQVAARHGVTRASVGVELDLWHALAAALHGRGDNSGSLGEATDAAYRTLLSRRPAGSFVDLELGLWKAFRDRWQVPW